MASRLRAATLPRRSMRAANGERGQRVFLRADKRVAYGEVMALMDDLRAAGYLKVGLVGVESDRRQ